MNDDPLEQIPSFDRVTIAAVLASDGEDVSEALAEAGIFDAIELRISFDGDLDASGVLLGDGFTPNLTAVVEFEQPQDEPDWQSSGSDSGWLATNAVQDTASETSSLPAAYGMKPVAPVRRRKS